MGFWSWILKKSSVARTVTGNSKRTALADHALSEGLRDLDLKQKQLDREVYATVRMVRRIGESREREVTNWNL